MNNIKRTSISLGTLGDSHVGKSVLTEIYLGHEFIDEYISTIGINANIKEEKLIINDEEQKIKIKNGYENNKINNKIRYIRGK